MKITRDKIAELTKVAEGMGNTYKLTEENLSVYDKAGELIHCYEIEAEEKTACYDDTGDKVCKWIDIGNKGQDDYCVEHCERMSEEEVKEGCSCFENCF